MLNRMLLTLFLVVGLLLPPAVMSYAQEGRTQPARPADKRHTPQPNVQAAAAATLSAAEQQARLKPRSAQAQQAAGKGMPLTLKRMSTRLPAMGDVQAAAVQGWGEPFAEDFEDMSEWTVSVSTAWLTTTVDAYWGVTNADADTEFNPASLQSSWPAALGVNAALPSAGYPPTMDTWMTYGPIDLSTMTAAEVYFSVKYDMLPYTGFGFCARAGITTADDFDWNEDCAWIQDWENGITTENAWEYFYLDLTKHVGESNLYIGLNFYNDITENPTAAMGVLVDELALWATDDTAFDPVDPNDEFANWDTIYDEQFDEMDPLASPNWKVINAGSWQWRNQAIAAATNGYNTDRRDWLIYGPVDLSNMQAADTDFLLNYNLIYNDDTDGANDDWLGFCVTATNKALVDVGADDFVFDNCDWYWDVSNYADWELAYRDLSAFVGESKVYLAWYFESNNSSPDGYALMDWLTIYGEPTTAAAPAIDYSPAGLALQNGDFADGITHWQTTGPGNVFVFENSVAFGPTKTYASLLGTVSLGQVITVPVDATALNINFTYAVSTTETVADTDTLCVHLSHTSQPFVIDLGCWDLSLVPENAADASVAELYGRTVNAEQIKAYLGQPLELVITLRQNDPPTATRVDITDIVVYTMGQAPRPNNPILAAALANSDTVATQRDNNESNDSADAATPISCGQSYEGVFGDVAPATVGDVDYYALTRVPAGTLVIDVDARSLTPPSDADAVVQLYTPQNELVAENDDESETLLDSKLVFNNQTAGATYFVKMYNYRADGPTNYYRFKVNCSSQTTPVTDEPANPPSPPTTQTGQANKKAWTVILYLNGEDEKCKEEGEGRAKCWDTQYLRQLEGLVPIVQEKGSFLNIAALLDGPNFAGEASDTRGIVVNANGLQITALPELNLADPDTLVGFVAGIMNQLPAEHYYVTVDDHGGGISGISWDAHGVDGQKIEDQITPLELRSALKSITANGQRKIDVFGFEACLMAMTENAYDIKEYVDFTYFFQPTTPLVEQYAPYLSKLAENTAPEELVKIVVDNYPGCCYSVAGVNTAGLAAIREKLDALVDDLIAQNVSVEQLRAVRGRTQNFYGEKGYSTVNGPAGDKLGYIDLWHFADLLAGDNLAPIQAGELKTAIDQAVVSVRKSGDATHVLDNAHGLSIYFPDRDSEDLKSYCADYALSNNGRSGWAKLLTTVIFPGVCPAGIDLGVVASAQQGGERRRNRPIMPVAKPAAVWSITTNGVGQGTVSADPPGPYTAGQQVTLTATPATGWVFSGWSGAATGTANPLTVTMDGNKNITATFVEQTGTTFALTTNVVGQGAVSANPQGPYAPGQQATLTATPAQGWIFSGWSGAASGTTNPLTVTMDSNKTITATFTEQSAPANPLYLPLINR